MLQVRKLALMTALCLFFSGCAAVATPENLTQKIREEYKNMTEITTSAEIKADYGNTVYQYKIRYTEKDDIGTIEIVEPQSIAGLCARVSSNKNELIYDEAELYVGEFSESGLSPIDALPAMISQWQNGHISESVSENINHTDALAITNRIDENIVLRTWFDVATHLPIRAEISDNGRVCITCEFENVIVHVSQQGIEESDEHFTTKDMGRNQSG